MGMDVYGNSGNYFRANIWGWHPLWSFVEDRHPDLADKVEYGHSNDGDGLDGADAGRLAQLLREDIASGQAQAYASERDASLAQLPDEICWLCSGTGVRTDAIGKQAGMPERERQDEQGNTHVGWCNGCDGKGQLRPHDTHYYLRVADIEEFADFLAESDGFRIC